MAVTLIQEFVLLFQMACVVFLFAYLFSKSRFYEQILEHRATIATQAFLAIAFGLLSIYGMSSGITFYTANVNIRDFGPMIAGLACGPWVGLGAGIIGCIYRLSVGGTNVYAVAIGPLTAGIVGGLVYYYSNRELVSTKKAVIITAIVETVVSAIAILIRILAGDSYEKYMTVSINVALPMIIMTTIAVGVFCIILHNHLSERRVEKEKMMLELEVESKRNLNVIINTIAFPVYVLDRDHHFILVNDSLCRFLSHSREEILGKTHRDFYRRDSAERHWVKTEAAFKTHETREEEVTITRPDGQECTIISTSTMYRDASGQEFMVGVIHDITERKNMQIALADSEEWYRTLFQHTGTATIIIDEEGKITQTNSEFEDLIGYRAIEIEGKMNWTQIAHPEDLELMKEYHKQRMIDPSSVPTGYTVRIHDRNGTVKTLHAVVALLPGTKKSIASYVDISMQKRYEENLTQMNRKLNLLSSITRHDIINQLMILSGFLALLKQKTDDPVLLGYIERSDKATRNIEHQISFTRDYQDMGVNAPVWQNVKSSLISAKGALTLGDVTVGMDQPGLEVFADPLFEKVFYNLIDNSLKYGGERLRTIRISSHEEEKGIIITYHDDGAGIPEGERPHLFERGFGKHSGFGLFLSREILAITDITIAETGTAGSGARFVIGVPRGMYRFRDGSTPRDQ